MTKRLLMAGASVRAQLAGAVRAGYEVIAFDFFADWDTKQTAKNSPTFTHIKKINNFESLRLPHILEAAQTCDAAILLGGLETRIELTKAVAQKSPLLGTSVENLSRLKDEVEVFKLLKASQITCPAVRFEIENETPDNWIKKRIGSASGIGVRRATVVDTHQRPTPDTYFQGKIEGDKVSAVFVSATHPNPNNETSATNTVLISLTQQLVGLPALGCGEFCYCGSIETDNVPQVQKNAILDCADALAGEFDIRGVWGIDFILNEAGAYPVDINCRITASAELTESRLREHSDFKSVLDLHVTACEKGLDDFTTPPQSSSAQGKLILFNRLDIPITISNSIFEVLTDGNSRGELADIPNLGTAIQPGFPIVTLKASQDNAASTKENMLHDAEQLYSLFQNGNA